MAAGADDEIAARVSAFLAEVSHGDAPRVEHVSRVSAGRSRENWVFDAVWTAGAGRCASR